MFVFAERNQMFLESFNLFTKVMFKSLNGIDISKRFYPCFLYNVHVSICMKKKKL